MRRANFENAVERLRGVLVAARARDGGDTQWEKDRDEVLNRYGPVFSTDHLPALTEAEFKSFLYPDNNKHWTGLTRKGGRACEDMDGLRAALSLMLDEEQPVEHRLNQAVESVPGMGRALATAILLVAFPDTYGVWNNTSEGSLKELKLWPEFERGLTFGQRYIKVNETLRRLADELGADLWTLDWLFGDLRFGPDEDIVSGPEPSEQREDVGLQKFGLERHLHEFLRDNWDWTELGKEWALYSEPGEPEAGYEYPCGVGRIDLLARNRSDASWLVIELKRNQTSDATVGQVLRYMGWVKRELAEPDENVKGLVIAYEADKGMLYALSHLPDVNLSLYRVEFHLIDPPEPGESAG